MVKKLFLSFPSLHSFSFFIYLYLSHLFLDTHTTEPFVARREFFPSEEFHISAIFYDIRNKGIDQACPLSFVAGYDTWKCLT